MGGLTENSPKCLVSLGGRPLLQWQIDALRGAGIVRIAIVTGWRREQLESMGAETVHNPRWAETNMVMSLACAEAWLRSNSCLVSYSDIFYSAATVSALIAAAGDICITYDPDWLALWSRRFADPLADAESFEIDAAGRVIEIGRRVTDARAIRGQYMGLLKFTPAGWAQTARLLETQSNAERDRLDMTGMLRQLIAAGVEVRALPRIGPWGEVDSASDLRLYEADLASGRMRP